MEIDEIAENHMVNEHITAVSQNDSNHMSSMIELLPINFQSLLNVDEDQVGRGMTLSRFLQLILETASISQIGYVDLQNGVMNDVFDVGNSCYIQLSKRSNGNSEEISHYELIIADNSDSEKMSMAVLTAESVDSELVEMDCSGMRENVIIDLNEEGRRWEGGELNGKPFGFGREYSEDDNLVYEGFVFEGMKVCVGKEWNDDSNNNCLMYKGGYCNNERWGKGISYDLTGNTDYKGKWMNNHGMTKMEKRRLKNSMISPLFYSENCKIIKKKFNDESITSIYYPSLLVRLKQIEIGNRCFQNVREFVIDGLPNLESVKIGEKCFRIDEWKERDDGICRITNCPNLRQLEIGDRSFKDFKSFELSNVNSLQSIKFGNDCFRYADFSLKGE